MFKISAIFDTLIIFSIGCFILKRLKERVPRMENSLGSDKVAITSKIYSYSIPSNIMRFFGNSAEPIASRWRLDKGR